MIIEMLRDSALSYELYGRSNSNSYPRPSRRGRSGSSLLSKGQPGGGGNKVE